MSINVHGNYNLLKFLIMKNLQNLKGAKALNKKEQQTINGGGPIGISKGPCGGTGGEVVHPFWCTYPHHGMQWYNGVCYACY